MHRAIWRGVQLATGILLAVTCVRGQDAQSFYGQVQGFGFVAHLSGSGEIDRVYLSGSGRIACLDGHTGRVIWSEKGPGLSTQGIPGAGPVIAGSTLVYMGGGGFFAAYGLDLQTGKTKWVLDKRSPALASGPGVVFLSTQGGRGIMAVDSQTGKVKWEHRAARVGGTLGKIVYSEGYIYTDSPEVWSVLSRQPIRKLSVDPDMVIAHSGHVYMAGDSIPLVAVDARTGKSLWKARNPLQSSPETTHQAFLAATGRYLVAAFFDGQAFTAKRGLVSVYDSVTGQILWEKTIASETSLLPNPVSVNGGFVYLLEPAKEGSGSKITAFEGRTGKQLWTYSNSDGFLGPVASAGGLVLASTGGARGSGESTALYALDSKTGSLRWKFSF